jgi:MFS family permease
MTLRRPHDVTVLALARGLSNAGTFSAYIAFTALLYGMTGSAVWLSLAVLVDLSVNAACAPVAGWLGDRFDRKRLIVLSELAGALVFVAFCFVGAPWQLVLLYVPKAMANSVFGPALNAAVPNFVPQERLAWANARIATAGSIGFVSGTLTGGALVAAAGPRAVFLFNAATFVASATAIASMRVRFRAAPAAGPGAHDDRMRAGAAFLLSTPLLRSLVIGGALIVMTKNTSLPAELPLCEQLGVGTVGFGMLPATAVAGGIVSAQVLGRRDVRPGLELRLLTVGAFVSAAALAFVGLSGAFPLVLLGIFLYGLSDGASGFATGIALQRQIPDRLRSRAFAAIGTLNSASFAAPFVFAGFLVDGVGPAKTFVVTGAATAVAACAIVVLARSVRLAQRVEHARPEERVAIGVAVDGERLRDRRLLEALPLPELLPREVERETRRQPVPCVAAHPPAVAHDAGDEDLAA